MLLLRSTQTTVNGIGLLVWNLDAELLLNGHDHLDGVERVQSKVIGEMRGSGDLSLIRIDSVEAVMRSSNL